jgi:hypothetical protein
VAAQALGLNDEGDSSFTVSPRLMSRSIDQLDTGAFGQFACVSMVYSLAAFLTA